MSKFVCKYCNKHLSSKTSLNNHISGAKYCIKNRDLSCETSVYKCDGCDKKFTLKQVKTRHMSTCIPAINDKYERQLREKEERIKELEDKLENIAISAVSRPINITNHQHNNNRIQVNNFMPITDKLIQEHVGNLTIEHIKAGASGYAKYALEYPLKDKIVCTDFSRRKVKYKNSDGHIITDPEMVTISGKLFLAIRQRNSELIKEYSKELQTKLWGIPNDGKDDLDEKEAEKLEEKMNEVSDVLIGIMAQDRQVKELGDGVRSEMYHEFIRHVCSGCVTARIV